MQKKKLAIIFLMIIFYIFINPLLLISSASGGKIYYQVHLKDMGWVNSVSDGEVGGTTGQARRMEAIKIQLNGIDGILKYKTHVQDYGWLNEVTDGKISGTTGQSKRMEAIIIKLENSSYNIKYRVHTKDIGWMNWVGSGEVAGTTGQSRRIEAIQIIVEKNGQVVDNQTISLGVDVSKFQGNIDWNKVKSSDVKFAIIRAGNRGYTAGEISEDPYFKSNVENAFRNGIKVGVYFFSSAINENEAIEEANFVLNLIDKYGLRNKITYPIAVDIEDFEGARNNALSRQEKTNTVKAFCDTIKNSGYTPIVYSYTYFLENQLYMEQLAQYDTWIADYYGNSWYKRNFTIWQYTDKGKINGIEGDVDLNYSYKNY